MWLHMDEGRESTGSSSSTEDSSYSSGYYQNFDAKDIKEERRRISSSSSLFLQRRFSFLSCIIVLALGGIANEAVGLAAAGTKTLPVTRSFSELEGSGMVVGGGAAAARGGMTAEHAMLLRNHDYRRSLRHHGRALLATPPAMPLEADFRLAGNYTDLGLYFAEIGLGTPPSNYSVQVDSGSDLSWVNCDPCPDCPSGNPLPSTVHLYNPAKSNTSSIISCSSGTCISTEAITEDNSCYGSTCGYSIVYGDGSTTLGYLVQDAFTYETGIVSNVTKTNETATVVFGCGFNQSGNLASTSREIDGIMGFGRQSISVVTQLADGRLTANEFAHCLQGSTGQGGFIVIGDVEEPGLVYTNMVQDQPHYNVVLESIDVDGVQLSISSSAFDTSPGNGDSGTIFDSGTTMAIVVDAAYNAFFNEISAKAPVPVVYPDKLPNQPCFQNKSDLSSSFPNVTLNFDGASMDLGPTNYLYYFVDDKGVSYWCIAWSSSSSNDLTGLTILGDIILQNKLVVYDLENERIGWVNYDCQSSVNVTNPSGAAHSLRVHHPIAMLVWSVLLMYATGFL